MSFLTKQSAKAKRAEGPEELHGSTGRLDHFLVETELDKQSVMLDYYVSKQTAGGATFAGRYPVKDATDLRKDVERIARSLQLIPPKR
jgi:hypothetical protein